MPSSFIYLQLDVVQKFGSVQHISCVFAVDPAPCLGQRGAEWNTWFHSFTWQMLVGLPHLGEGAAQITVLA